MMNDELQNALISKDTFLVGLYASKGSRDIGDDQYLANQLHNYKWTLYDVIDIENTDLTKLFIENDVSIDLNSIENSCHKWTALHQAICCFDEYHVQLLLDHNADPNSFNDTSRTPLSYLYEDCEGYSDDDAALEILKMMINRGAQAVTVTNNTNTLQVEGILCAGNSEVISTALNLMNIDVRARYANGETVAHYLAKNVNSEFSKIMGDREFDVNARNNTGEMPLYCASNICYAEAIEFLLSKGADVNAVNNSNCTPVYAATGCYNLSILWDEGCIECVMLLLEHNADIQLEAIKDGLPHTVFDLVMQKHTDDKLCKIMLQYLALEEAIGTKITSLIKGKIDSNEGMKQYYALYTQVLPCKVYQSETLFELLTSQEEKLIPYMRNEEIKEAIFSFCDKIKSALVYYHRLLKKRVITAEKVGKLRDLAAVVIGKLTGISYNCHPFVLDTIMRFLDCQDLNSLLSV